MLSLVFTASSHECPVKADESPHCPHVQGGDEKVSYSDGCFDPSEYPSNFMNQFRR